MTKKIIINLKNIQVNKKKFKAFLQLSIGRNINNPIGPVISFDCQGPSTSIDISHTKQHNHSNEKKENKQFFNDKIIRQDNFHVFPVDKFEQEILISHENTSICNSVSIDDSLSNESFDRIPLNPKNENEKNKKWWKRKKLLFCCFN